MVFHKDMEDHLHNILSVPVSLNEEQREYADKIVQQKGKINECESFKWIEALTGYS